MLFCGLQCFHWSTKDRRPPVMPWDSLQLVYFGAQWVEGAPRPGERCQVVREICFCLNGKFCLHKTCKTRSCKLCWLALQPRQLEGIESQVYKLENQVVANEVGSQMACEEVVRSPKVQRQTPEHFRIKSATNAKQCPWEGQQQHRYGRHCSPWHNLWEVMWNAPSSPTGCRKTQNASKEKERLTGKQVPSWSRSSPTSYKRLENH